MSQSAIIAFILFYCQTQTLAADNMNATIDKMINSSIKASVRPCGDFYFYACGNYNEQAFFNSTIMHNNLHDYANHQYNTALINLLETYNGQELHMEESCHVLAVKIKNYYEACRKVGKRNLIRYLEEMKPGPELNWPILENDSSQLDKLPHDKDFDVFYLLGKLKSFGIRNFIVRAYDNRRTWRKGVKIELIDKYYNPLNKEEILTKLSVMEIENASQIVKGILETEEILLKISEDKEKNNEADVEIEISFGDFIKRYPNLNFTTYFREYLGEQLPLDTNILLVSPYIFHRLNEEMWSLLDKSKLCSFIMMHYLLTFDTNVKLNATTCLNEMRVMFDFAVNFLYYQYHFDYQEKFVKPDVTEIFRTLIDMFVKHVESHDLELAPDTMKTILRSFSRLKLNMGNIPINTTCQKAEQLHSNLPPMDLNNYYKNHLNALRFRNSASFKTYLHNPDELRFSSQDAIMYDYTKDTITIMYAYLIPPVYDFRYNKLDKYSLLGFILADQLLEHSGFYSIYHRKKSQPVESILKCFEVEPNSRLSFRRMGDNVIIEVIRKIVTLKFYNLQSIESVSAWKKHFFLTVAQHYCHLDNRESYHPQRQSDDLNQSVMDSEDFSKVFNCPEGSEMNPSKKCISIL